MKREEHGAWVGRFPEPEQEKQYDGIDMFMAKAIGFFTAIVCMGIMYGLFEAAVWLQIVKK